VAAQIPLQVYSYSFVPVQTVIVSSGLHVLVVPVQAGKHPTSEAGIGDALRSAQLALRSALWQFGDRMIAAKAALQLVTLMLQPENLVHASEAN
jgi:hypothetical protein